jgi:23S rRNA G2445 N2-methylase RlmL
MPARSRSRTPTRRPTLDGYALVVPGLEDLAAAEIAAAGAEVTEVLEPRDRRASIVLFRAADLAPMLRCGLLEDVFVAVASDPALGTRPPSLASATLTRATIERALLAHHAVRPKRAGRSFRVVARMSGRHRFRREDIERAWERALGRLLTHWVVRRPATLELWVHVVEDRLLAGIRLSGDDLAQRSWKIAHLPASLKPTIARAMVLLSEPRYGDIVLDPMCGAGTLLRESMDAGRCRLVAGGDIAGDALEAARTNAGRQAALARWDATRLPARTASVDVVLTNPPFGRRHAVVAGIDKLYARMLREAARVLKPGGRCVVLTGEPTALSRALPDTLRVRAKRRIVVRGLTVTAYVMMRA